MIPYKSIIVVQRTSKQPVYLQICNQIIDLIKKQILAPNTRLPSSRSMAALLEVHRKTIIASYDELLMQGWIISIPKKGTYIHSSIPVLRNTQLKALAPANSRFRTSFPFHKNKVEASGYTPKPRGFMTIKDGVADERLAPIDAFTNLYKNILSRQNSRKYIGYGTMYGNPVLREVLVEYLKETRGLNIAKENILITRGSQMGMFLAAQLLINEDDYVVVGSTNYDSATRAFRYSKSNVLDVPVDEEGLQTEELEQLCKKFIIKAVYVTPHHHHPTTVMLSAQRRMHLLNLAQKYNFAIIEDDYDYDFHYNHAPILPLASHDQNGHVIYVGSFCKTVAPVYRVGYLIAPKDFVDECAELRGIIDRQGDALLELTFASFIKNGSLDKHIRRVLKIYRQRRDLFCELLEQELGPYVHFKIPLGGMAVWVIFLKGITIVELARAALDHKLLISNWEKYYCNIIGNQALRIGFAAYDEQEIKEVILRLKKSLLQCIAKREKVN